MELSKLRLAELTKCYGSTDLVEIQDLLIKCPPMQLTEKGIGSIYGYYTYDDQTMKVLAAGPRKVGLNLHEDAQVGQLNLNVSKWKTIQILNKSMSHMVLKVDVGEVYDAMSAEEKKEAKGFIIEEGTATLYDESGDFIVEVTLLK